MTRRQHDPATSGFTMVELVGVLAIIATLALVLVPVLIQQLNRMAAEAEATALQQQADGLKNYILRTRTMPDASGYAAALSAEMGVPLAAITQNARQLSRVCWIDPALSVGTSSNSYDLPYTQNRYGSTTPASVRLLLISSLGKALPATVVNGVPSTTTKFNNVWNVADGGIPSDWSWSGGLGTDLIIQRINLNHIFVRVVLDNDTNSLGKYSIDGSTAATLPTTPFTAYFIRGTVLDLKSSTDVLQDKEVLQFEDVSFNHTRGVWRGRYYLGRGLKTLIGSDLQAAADLFLTAPYNTSAKSGTTQQNAIDAMSTFMLAYISWAQNGFPTTSSGQRAVNDAQTDLDLKTTNLIYRAASQ